MNENTVRLLLGVLGRRLLYVLLELADGIALETMNDVSNRLGVERLRLYLTPLVSLNLVTASSLRTMDSLSASYLILIHFTRSATSQKLDQYLSKW